ncbi:hypothetical protein RchiOBHm_Chr2g0176501 [Rosa chinensis]|uniref:U5 small nuclear ribonucleoprotein TSSC4 n=1 Tax=Rosa chinensis TaxID=74649 RepID=A0A2P6S6M9_ROSCH|nr:hypothetical protein RchiOBHm_Chr2g0176501 [Rosa chinensis]
MEESFSVRVSKTFDILDGSSPSATASAPSSSLWSLTGEEIEKREWNRDKGSPEPQPRPCNPDSNSKDDFFGNELEKDLLDLDDDDDDDVEEEEEEDEVVEEQSAKPKPKPKPMPDDYNEEQWQIKTCIGLDCTLDHERKMNLTKWLLAREMLQTAFI